MLLKQLLERIGVKIFVLRNHVDDARHVCNEVALVLVGQDCRDGSIVEFNILVVDLDKVDVGIFGHQRSQSFVNEAGYLALRIC